MEELIDAASEGDLARVKAYLEQGVDPNSTFQDEDALGRAVLNQDLEMTRMLLAAGASPRSSRWLATTPLYTAAKYGRIDLLEMLLAAGASPADELSDLEIAFRSAEAGSGKLESTCLHGAAESGDLAIMQRLMEAGG